MKLPVALALLTASCLCAQTPDAPDAPQPISAGAKVFISDMNGFESDVQAAFAKERIPLEIVTDKSRAQYIVTGKVEMMAPGARSVFRARSPEAYGSITLSTADGGRLAFYCPAHKMFASNGWRDIADKCSRKLREAISPATTAQR